ncbi:MAG TPA: xanthine dehydrogenase family protein molybdopterin-binding subunit [Methylomirabilota bacterium]|nr:xanthine dehydrogenase family protein molybdopterin-binding subunit [Methylomirabilota bacterium]
MRDDLGAGPPPRYVGVHVKRVEDPRLLTGQGRFLDDIPLPGLLHAAFVRSEHAHAMLRRVDPAAARAVAGVELVLTGRDLDGAVAPIRARLDAPGFAATGWPVLASSRVRFVGEAVAVVAAATPYAAADGGARVEVDYEPLPAVPDVDAARAPRACLLHPEHASNVLFARRGSRGDVDGAFATAAHVIRETFTHGRCSAAPLEGRGVIARWEGDTLTLWTGSQVPHIFRAGVARALGLAEARVRVVVCDTGGGFGQKMHVMPEDVAVAALARRAGRPVKWLETRRENLAAAAHAREERVEIEAAATADGTLLALRSRVLSDAGAYHIYPLTAALEPLGTASILPGPYRTPAYAFEVAALATTKPPLGAYRGVGMTMGAFVMERTLDLLADRLGLDPAEIRRRNLIPRDAYPFTSAAGFVYDSGDYPGGLERALTLAHYEQRKRERDAGRARGRLLGVGVACYTEYTGIGSETYQRRGMVDVPGPEAATVAMDAEGGVTVRVSFPSQGQGHATTVAQLVADEIGVPLDAVSLAPLDTSASPPGTGTFASRGVVAQGGAVVGAAADVRRALLALAAEALEASAADLEIAGGRIRVRGMPDRGIAVREVARRAHERATGSSRDARHDLEATQVFDPPGPTFSGAVHMAAVEVDPDTGRVEVLAYTVVEDCGPVVNPMIVEGQVHGAIAQGIGEALSERLVYDAHGQLVTGTLMDYALPVAATLPSFTVAHMETPSPLTPGGYKGMGEGGTIGAPAAIANAVADAVKPLGVAITTLPILPETLVGGSPEPR